MTTTEIEKKLHEVLRELSVKALTEPPQIKDVVVDSLDLMKLVVKLEETFGVYIDEQHLADPRMFDTDYLVGVIEGSLRQKSS